MAEVRGNSVDRRTGDAGGWIYGGCNPLIGGPAVQEGRNDYSSEYSLAFDLKMSSLIRLLGAPDKQGGVGI